MNKPTIWGETRNVIRQNGIIAEGKYVAYIAPYRHHPELFGFLFGEEELIEWVEESQFIQAQLVLL